MDIYECRASADVVSYQWLFGFADVAEGETVTHTFPTAEPYRVCLTVTFADSYTVTSCHMVHVGQRDRPGAA